MASNILDVPSFRGADCDTDHCLVVEKVKETLAVSKRVAQKSHVERYNFKKIIELDFRKQ